MADEVARRRELRRRRILENAEERKQKIFGTTTDINVDSVKENKNPNEVNLQDSNQSHVSKSSLKNEDGSANSVSHIPYKRTLPTLNSTELQNSVSFNRGQSEEEVESRSAPNFRAENGIESVPEITEQLRNLNDILTANGSRSVSATPTRKINDVQPATAVGALSTPIVPVIIALFVCILLSVNLGYVVSNSIALPFLLREAQHLWRHRHIIEGMSRSMGGLMGLALVLCGVHQSVISKMTQIITVVKCVFEDFAFYLLTVVIWYCLIGLPGSVHSVNEYSEPVHSVNEYSEPETVKVRATNDDIFEMEDF